MVTETPLAADGDDVWAHVTTPVGINDELRPVLRMTIPRRWQGATIADLAPGEHVGRSWLLLGGVLPFEFDDLTVAEVGPGRRFLEVSTMALYAAWTHERRVDDGDGDHGCVVRDRVGFVLRRPFRWVPGMAEIHQATVRRIFRHRHRRLQARFGRRGDTTQTAAVHP